jgi:hypothetical protein
LAQSREAAAVALREKLESVLGPFLDQYDFKGALAKCEQSRGALGAGDQQPAFEEAVARLRLLVDLKEQIILDIEQKALSRSDLKTRNRSAVEGRLFQATDQQLKFRSASGDTVTDWGDLPPETMLRIAEGYATGIGRKDRTDQLVKRYKMLAAFCQQYARPDDAARFLDQIAKIQAKDAEKK